MTYVCIGCGCFWVEGVPTRYPDISGGVCIDCFVDWWKRKGKELSLCIYSEPGEEDEC